MEEQIGSTNDAIAAAFDRIKKNITQGMDGGPPTSPPKGIIKVADLMPGLYAGIIESARGLDSPNFGPQISLRINLQGIVSTETKDIAYWCDYGAITVIVSLAKPDKVEWITGVIASLGTKLPDGSPIQTGGDILRVTEFPKRYVNVQLIHSKFTNKTTFMNLYLPFYEYDKAISAAPKLEREPSAPKTPQPPPQGSGSFLSDVPPF